MKKFQLILGVAVLALFIGGQAMANPISYLQISDGIHSAVTVYDQQNTGWIDIDPTSSIGILHQVLGDWTIKNLYADTTVGNPDAADLGGLVEKTSGIGTETLTITYVSYFSAAQGAGSLELNLSASALGPKDITTMSSTTDKYTYRSNGSLVSEVATVSVGPSVLDGTAISDSNTVSHPTIIPGYAMVEIVSITTTGKDAGTSFDAASSNTVVPEPASLLMLGTGLIGMGVFARRKLR